MRDGIDIANVSLVVLALFVMAIVLTLFPTCSAPEQPVEEKSAPPPLYDLNIVWQNEYDAPVDEISCRINSTGQIFVAPLIRDIFILPGNVGVFVASLRRDEYLEAIDGYEVVNVRCR